jgi:hypothetical protein
VSGPQKSLPIVLYSTITTLAYLLGERYYRSVHYVWCAPSAGQESFLNYNPPSSDPLAIYWELHEAIRRDDEHCARIRENRVGLVKGAAAQESQGIITEHDRLLIETIVARASLRSFLPLLVVIPTSGIDNLVHPADINALASALSEEYVIEALPRSRFDVLKLRPDP